MTDNYEFLLQLSKQIEILAECLDNGEIKEAETVKFLIDLNLEKFNRDYEGLGSR